MHDSAWMKLLRHIPASDQSKLMLVTSSGTEITIQCILRIDPECLALRGRLAGSTDSGRVFFVPYAHIDYFGFQQPLKEAEFHELFASLDELAAAAPAEPPPAPPAVALDSAAPPKPPANPTPPRGPSVIKSTVLEKFRARSISNPGTQNRPPLDE
jgi:hypothetical protein